MLNIKMQENRLNLKSDTEFLHHAYTNIINFNSVLGSFDFT